MQLILRLLERIKFGWKFGTGIGMSYITSVATYAGLVNSTGDSLEGNFVVTIVSVGIPIGIAAAIIRGKPPVLPWDDLDTAMQNLSEIDEFVLSDIRDHESLSTDRIIESYENQLGAELVKRKTSREIFIRSLTDFRYVNRLQSQILKPGLTIDLDKDLRKMRMSCNENSLEITDPTLLWDCHCNTPKLPEREKDGVVFSQKDCPIHGTSIGNTIQKAMRESVVQINYNYVSMWWKQRPEFWPPSMDTFTMLKDLEATDFKDYFPKTLIDIGTGSGILATYLAYHTPFEQSFHKVILTDWLLMPLAYASMNWHNQFGSQKKIRMEFIPCLHTAWPKNIVTKQFDLAVCNPPYLPVTREFHDLRLASTIGGTDLLEHLIRKGRQIAKRTYVSFSNIAMKEAILAQEQSGVMLKEVGAPRKIPFRIPAAFSNLSYLEWLIQDRGLIYDNKHRHRYWHTITTYEIS